MPRWKQYYKCFRFYSDHAEVDYWHTNKTSFLLSTYDLILPMGYRKPSSLNDKEIKE